MDTGVRRTDESLSTNRIYQSIDFGDTPDSRRFDSRLGLYLVSEAASKSVGDDAGGRGRGINEHDSSLRLDWATL